MAEPGTVRKTVKYYEGLVRRNGQEAKSGGSRSSPARSGVQKREIIKEEPENDQTVESDQDSGPESQATLSSRTKRRSRSVRASIGRRGKPSASRKSPGRSRSVTITRKRGVQKRSTKQRGSAAAKRGRSRTVRKLRRARKGRRKSSITTNLFDLNLAPTIRRLKRQLMPKMRLTGQCVEVIQSIVLDIIDRVSETSHILAMQSKKKSITLDDIEKAITMSLPDSWAKQCIQESNKAMKM